MATRILFALAFAIGACGTRPPVSETEAVAIANAHILERDPEVATMRPFKVGRVIDNGDTWRVEYELNSGWIGGAPKLVVDKQSRRVIRDENTEQ